MRYFLLLYALFLTLSLYFLVCFSKQEIFIWTNSRHNSLSDEIFQIITYLGDGLFAALVVVLLAAYKIRIGLAALASFVGTGLAVQLLKRLVFTDHYRPVKYFEGILDIYVIPGLDVHSINSFPSGHTATAFSVFFLIVLVVAHKKPIKINAIIGVVSCFLALGVGYSRIYLAQHFLLDVVAGSVIGLGITWVVFCYFIKSRHFSKDWLEKSILNINK